jgi:heptosyltransferase-2
VDLLKGRLFSELLTGNPNLDRIVVYNQLACIRMPWKFFTLIYRLRKERYDIVFDLKPSFSFNNMMMTVLSGARFRVGFRNPLSSAFFHLEADLPDVHTYEPKFIAALLSSFMDIEPVPSILYTPSPSDVLDAKRQLAGCGMTDLQPVGIHIGGRGNKKLDLTCFIALARRLKEKETPVIFFIGPDEKRESAAIKREGFVCFAPKTAGLFGGFLPHLRAFVSCDTGPMHMAAGAGVKTVSVFLTTSVERFAPKGDKSRNLMATKEMNLTEQIYSMLTELNIISEHQ